MAAVPSCQILKTAFQVVVFCTLNHVDILQLPENNYLGLKNSSKSISDEQVSFVILVYPLINTTILTLDSSDFNFWQYYYAAGGRWPPQFNVPFVVGPDQTVWCPAFFSPVEIEPGVVVYQLYQLVYLLVPIIQPVGETVFVAPRPLSPRIDMRQLEELAENL